MIFSLILVYPCTLFLSNGDIMENIVDINTKGDLSRKKGEVEMVTTLSTKKMVDYALEYAAQGIPVFPVYPMRNGRCACGTDCGKNAGKHPFGRLVPNGVDQATTDENTIRRWWSQAPDANIGAAAGKAAGHIVLDIDARENGPEKLRDLEQKLGMLPETRTVLSGSGNDSCHYHFKAPEGVELRGKLVSGVDIKGEGGYTLMPPSNHKSGGKYTWDLLCGEDHEIATLPDAWVEAMTKPYRGETVDVGPFKIDPEAEAPVMLDYLLAKSEKFRLSWENRRRDLKDDTPSGYDQSLANYAAMNGWSPQDIVDLLIAHRRKHGHKEKHELYYRLTVERALAWATTHNRKQKVSAGMKETGSAEKEVELNRRPKVAVNTLQLRDIVKICLEALKQKNNPPKIFQRGGELVHARTDEDGGRFIDHLDVDSLSLHLSELIDFVKELKNGEAPAQPPERAVKSLRRLPSFPFPALEGIVTAPVVKDTGEILDTPGYDADTRLIYQPTEGLTVPKVPEKPTQVDIDHAKQQIQDLIGEFPFQTAADYTNAVALLLTPIMRRIIQGSVPLALVNANKRGTGKGLLVEVISLVTTGKQELGSDPGSEEEWRKTITTMLDAGQTFITFDEMTKLSSKHLAAALTAPSWSARRTGTGTQLNLPIKVTWAATGNNVQLGGDMDRRVYLIQMKAKTARPWEKAGFKHPNLVQYAEENRGRILWALLTLVRAWYAAGCPKAKVRTMGRFEDWSEKVGGVLAYAGYTGFLDNQNRVYEEMDNQEDMWAEFLAMFPNFFDKPAPVKNIADAIQGNEDWRDLAPDEVAEAQDARQLARILRQKRDTPFPYGTGTISLKRTEKKTKGMYRWYVDISKKE